ncbi:hypothetical protein [Massilia sp. TN1-12]|uniref:hypothetical protein n=1 Tax=Massilia paldalensis TaxID=3377675 RepID=UPI00384C8D81
MPGFNSPVLSPSAFTRRIDGIDVSQLLRDIGEATARTGSIELFRLCLNAQQVLTATASIHTKNEAALLAAYRAMDDRARADMLPVMQSVAEQAPRHRPPLTLVQHSQRGEAV